MDQGVAIVIAGVLAVAAAAVAVVGSVRAGKAGADTALRANREQIEATAKIQTEAWSRQDRERFQEFRRECYVRLLDAVFKLDYLAWAPPDQDINRLVVERLAEVATAKTRVDLLGRSTEVSVAAEKLGKSCTDLAFKLAAMYQAETTPNAPEYQASRAQMMTARGEFIVIAKNDLGIG